MSDLREQFEKEQKTKIVDDSSLQDYIEWLENKLMAIDAIKRADKIRKEYE